MLDELPPPVWLTITNIRGDQLYNGVATQWFADQCTRKIYSGKPIQLNTTVDDKTVERYIPATAILEIVIAPAPPE